MYLLGNKAEPSTNGCLRQICAQLNPPTVMPLRTSAQRGGVCQTRDRTRCASRDMDHGIGDRIAPCRTGSRSEPYHS